MVFRDIEKVVMFAVATKIKVGQNFKDNNINATN